MTGLHKTDLRTSPFDQFAEWYDHARPQITGEPTQMVLATADSTGQPSARIVLLKDFDHDGFVFFTNYQSRKAQELAANPRATLLWYWPATNRQVRVEGSVSKLPPEDSDAYFATRALKSQLGAWASEQSRPLDSRALLETRFEEYAKRYANQPIPRPPHWGGFLLKPDYFEFWQNGENRLHDRFEYRLVEKQWNLSRLNP